jgi:hypothetical protein
MVSPEALKLNEILRNAPKAVDMDLPHQREAGEHAEDMTSEPVGVTYEEAYEVDGLWATPESWDGESAIMYLYGGGYVISSPHSRRKLAGHLANASGARALVPRARAPLSRSGRGCSCRLPVAAQRGRATRADRRRRGLERRGARGRHGAQAARGRCVPAGGRRPPSRRGWTSPARERRSTLMPRRISQRPKPACSAWQASTFTGRIRALRWPPHCTLTSRDCRHS